MSIYAYIDSLTSVKVSSEGERQICLIEPYIKTHKRHFIQQGQYTLSLKKLKKGWCYCPHDESLEDDSDIPHIPQSILRKYILPSKLRDEVLRKLFEMNINSYTLFNSEESLMETLAYKEIKIREYYKQVPNEDN